jgi:ribonucleoside-triphosphate reductase
MKIIKRDGRIANFDQNKIIDAVLAAFKAVDGEITDYAYTKAKNISNYILDFCKEYKRTAYEEWTNSTEKEWAGKPNLYLNVEQIQDLVEKGLMSTKRKDVAKEYITYRKVRDIERTKQSELRKTVLEKIIASNPQNQNANVDEESFGGRVGEASSVQMKDIALNEIMSKWQEIII